MLKCRFVFALRMVSNAIVTHSLRDTFEQFARAALRPPLYGGTRRWEEAEKGPF